MKWTCVLLTLALFSFSAAHADVMVEPWLGYEVGKLKCSDLSGGNCGGEVTGLAQGARVGYKSARGMWIAAEYSGSYEQKATQPAPADDIDWTRNSIGLTLGMDFRAGLRLFAGYNFIEKVEIRDATNWAGYSGTSVKVGAGYRLPKYPIAFNVEWMDSEYNKLRANGATLNISDRYTSVDHSGLIVSVSSPLTF